jgi:hypothetical protein
MIKYLAQKKPNRKTDMVKPVASFNDKKSGAVVINGPATKFVLSGYMKYLEIREDSRVRMKAHCSFSI